MAKLDPQAVGGAIAVLGDLHSAWENEDLAYFRRGEYPLLLVTGDLGRTGSLDGRNIARALAQVGSEVLVMPGNNDLPDYPHIRAELTYRRARADLLPDALAEGHSLPPQAVCARLCGYSLHPLELNGLALSIVAARPFSMGGPELSFPEAIARLYNVRSLRESGERLCELVDAANTEHLVFFAHNGPTGLGGSPRDIWGRDFHADAGDWGDADLRFAIDYARSRKRKVLAVVAGHMHWQLSGRPGVYRRWQLQRDGVLYINSARVPRVFSQAGRSLRAHIRLQLTAADARAVEVLVSDPDQA